MGATNDYPRPPRRPAAWLRGIGLTLALGGAAAGAAWTLRETDSALWPIVRAASVFPIGDAADDRPQYVGEALVQPRDWERWIAIGASLGLSYAAPGASPHEAFHQVRIAPSAYDAFRRTGAFPEGTQIALEISSPGAGALPARAGRFADRREGLEIAVKDRRAAPDGWAYYGFGDGAARTGRRFPAASCSSCHRRHAASDNVFTQFYPRLRARS